MTGKTIARLFRLPTQEKENGNYRFFNLGLPEVSSKNRKLTEFMTWACNRQPSNHTSSKGYRRTTKQYSRGKMDGVDLEALASDLGFVLKSEQKEAVESLLKGRDVFGVLPTGFGKSLIFQLFVLAKTRASNSQNASSVERPTNIVICPLKSIMEEQITSNEFGLSAAELRFDGETLNYIRNGEGQVSYRLCYC